MIAIIALYRFNQRNCLIGKDTRFFSLKMPDSPDESGSRSYNIVLLLEFDATRIVCPYSIVCERGGEQKDAKDFLEKPEIRAVSGQSFPIPIINGVKRYILLFKRTGLPTDDFVYRWNMNVKNNWDANRLEIIPPIEGLEKYGFQNDVDIIEGARDQSQKEYAEKYLASQKKQSKYE